MSKPAIFATLGLAAAIAAPPLPASQAQGAPPPGSYQRYCRDIRQEGLFLHAWCQGSRGSGESSINVRSCSGDIGVSADGALMCNSPPSRGRPLPVPQPPPRPQPPGRPGDDYGRPDQRREITLFDRSDYRGRDLRIWGETPNLDRSGFNDRVRSIQLPRRGPDWLVCENANYRGRCVTISRSVEDTRRLGLGDSISSLRPLR
jgi:hypothetical protein